MKCVAALAVFAAPSTAQLVSGTALVNDPVHIEHINSHADNSWVAAPQGRFEGLTLDDARMLLGTRLSHISKHLNSTRHQSIYDAMDDAPKNFDSRKHWDGLIHPIRDQKQCGSCWAFSSSEVLSDRVAISKGAASPVLSPEDMVSCDKKDSGCNGGELPLAWKYLSSTGIVTDACMPYEAGGGLAPKCTLECSDSEDFVRTKAASTYAIHGPANMQKDIMTHGPIQVGFMVYRSFMSYQSGVYHKLKSEQDPEGGHAVKIVGWGMQGGKAYWTVANSWNTNWGEDGFFRIRRGVNECGIEEMGPPYAGLPSAEESSVIVV